MQTSHGSNIASPTTTRVPSHTPDYLNQKVQSLGLENVVTYAANPERIDQRLSELNREWDIERVLEANASSLVVLGTRWAIWPASGSTGCPSW